MMAGRVAILLLALTSSMALAAPAVWAINSEHSFAQFSVRTLWFTHERGRFNGLHGELRRNDVDRAVVDAWIDAASLVMDDSRTLEEARGAGFFDVVQYPRIHFVSSPFAETLLREGGILQGTLDLRGQRQHVQFELMPSSCPAQPLTCAIRVHGTLSRSAFGMRAHRGLLADRVSLDLDIALGEPG